MYNLPLVSIIINNYNYGRFLRAAITSALAQSYKRTEVIVVDDGSTDESQAVIAGFGERVVAVLKENGGQGSAFNAGLAASSGEVVIFLDADDLLMPETVARVVSVFHSRPEVAKVMYRMAVVDACGRPTGAVKPAPHVPLLSGDLRRHVLAFPDDLPWLPTSGNAFCAAVLRRIMPIPEAEYRILADFYLSHLTPLFGPVAVLPAVGAQYRVHGGNNYEVTGLDLAQIRRTIVHWRQTHGYLQRFAASLGLVDPAAPPAILSVAYAASRLASLKLDPAQHPIPGDTVWVAVHEGTAAALQRFDIAPPLKGLFVAWFAAMASAPPPIARRLAALFFIPERRRGVNYVLRHWNRRPLTTGKGIVRSFLDRKI